MLGWRACSFSNELQRCIKQVVRGQLKLIIWFSIHFILYWFLIHKQKAFFARRWSAASIICIMPSIVTTVRTRVNLKSRPNYCDALVGGYLERALCEGVWGGGKRAKRPARADAYPGPHDDFGVSWSHRRGWDCLSGYTEKDSPEKVKDFSWCEKQWRCGICCRRIHQIRKKTNCFRDICLMYPRKFIKVLLCYSATSNLHPLPKLPSTCV